MHQAAETYQNLATIIVTGAVEHIAHEAVQAVHCRITEPLKCLCRYFVVLLCHILLMKCV